MRNCVRSRMRARVFIGLTSELSHAIGGSALFDFFLRAGSARTAAFAFWLPCMVDGRGPLPLSASSKRRIDRRVFVFVLTYGGRRKG